MVFIESKKKLMNYGPLPIGTVLTLFIAFGIYSCSQKNTENKISKYTNIQTLIQSPVENCVVGPSRLENIPCKYDEDKFVIDKYRGKLEVFVSNNGKTGSLCRVNYFPGWRFSNDKSEIKNFKNLVDNGNVHVEDIDRDYKNYMNCERGINLIERINQLR